ncbi:hypothetical protein FA09DRAFT_269099 [Tilletiopsis washingtonensis]|jgi:hypothetical protein|uniref:Uncharacterized protein n=1 Tax=Tilletiopsis washingtonensis TaxID=58919 RepID=A0A316ZA28_9BASI|nr:hypothetical protein FA09DRAFT_269099 [Tilletiopsis washingtonensis]PWN98550.1 hypothetical protein FA09DRAFT_269099 [Tilletiopsis washingtonensis]
MPVPSTRAMAGSRASGGVRRDRVPWAKRPSAPVCIWNTPEQSPKHEAERQESRRDHPMGRCRHTGVRSASPDEPPLLDCMLNAELHAASRDEASRMKRRSSSQQRAQKKRLRRTVLHGQSFTQAEALREQATSRRAKSVRLPARQRTAAARLHPLVRDDRGPLRKCPRARSIEGSRRRMRCLNQGQGRVASAAARHRGGAEACRGSRSCDVTAPSLASRAE